MLKQVAKDKADYPGYPIVYVFDSSRGDVPENVIKALTDAGVTVMSSPPDKVLGVGNLDLPGAHTAQQAVEAFLAQRQPDLRLIAYFLGDLRLEIWFSIEPQEGRISFLIDHEHFNGSDEGRAAFEKLLTVLKETYAHWHPFYGYEIYHGDGGAQPDRAIIQATHEIQHIYTINFLGPEIVEKLGRERVLSAPAWRNEPLDDGGVIPIICIFRSPINAWRWPWGCRRRRRPARNGSRISMMILLHGKVQDGAFRI